MAKIVRTVFVSLAAIALCIALIVAGSYALYTDGVTVKNHLVAGSMQVKLERTNLISTKLDTDGYLTTTESNPTDDETLYVDFSGETEENVFGLGASEKLVPCSSYTAEMLLSNESDVAFSYWIEIRLTEGYEDTALAKQLKLTVTVEGEANGIEKTLDQGLTVGGESAPVGVVVVGASQAFTVTVSFEDLDTNNEAQAQEVQFDLLVRATQVTEAA